MPTECQHENLCYMDGMSGWEPPYDGTDIWWRVTCEDCEADIAEGDGYYQPDWVKELAK